MYPKTPASDEMSRSTTFTILPNGGRVSAFALVLLFVVSAIAFGGFSQGPVAHAAAPTIGAPTSIGSSSPTALSLPVPGTSVGTSTVSVSTSSARLPTVLATGPMPAGRLSMASLGAATGSSLLAPAVPAAAGTDSNWFVMSPTMGTSAALVGSSPSNLLVTGWSEADTANSSGLGSFYLSHGQLGFNVADSTVLTNGGHSFHTLYAGQATAWSGTGSPIFMPAPNSMMFSQVTPYWAASPTTNPVVAATTSGTVVALAPYASSCWTQPTQSTSVCENSGGTYYSNSTIDGNQGLAAVVSSNNGQTWGTPVVLSAQPWLKEYWYNGNCSTAGIPAQQLIVPQQQTWSSALAINTVGGKTYVYAAWVLIALGIEAGSYPFTCTSAGLQYAQGAFTSLTFSLYLDVSSNGGSTWGTPTMAAQTAFPATGSNSLYAGYIPSGPWMNNVQITAGPGPSNPVTVEYVDIANTSTSSGASPFAFVTNATATTWNAPHDASISTMFVENSRPAWLFQNSSGPSLTTDSGTSTHKGNLYLAWSDNITTAPGTPSIEVSVNSGSGWSAPKVVSTSNAGLYYFDPSVTVQPNGTVWVGYYGFFTGGSSAGAYNIYGVYSTNGGSTWSNQFVISDAVSNPTAGEPVFYSTPSLVGTSTGTYAFWNDCRSQSCSSAWLTSNLYNLSVFYAEVHPVTVSSTAAKINATITIGGVATTYALPASLAWETNLSVTVSVPTWVATPNGTYIDEFSAFSGASTSSADPTTFLYTGGNLVADYVLTPGSWVTGTISPIVSGAKLVVVETSTGQSVTATLTAQTSDDAFNVTVPGGLAYTVTASAPKYQAGSQTVTTTNFQRATVTFTLVKINGWISGAIAATTGAEGVAGAQVTIDSAPIGASYNPVSGQFNVTEPWGAYWVNVTEAGYICTTQAVPYSVGPGATTVISSKAIPTWCEGGWLNGTLNPGSAILKFNGIVETQNLTISGLTATFNIPVPGATWTVTATAPGQSTYNETWTIQPGTGRQLSITLTNKGAIEGYVNPAVSQGSVPTVLINRGVVSVLSTGLFNVQEVASTTPYAIEVTLTGYQASFANVTVVPGVTSWVNFSLNPVKTCATDKSLCPPPQNCTTNASLCPPKTTNNGLSTLDYVGIGIVVVLIIVIAAVLLTRRGGGATTMSSPTTDSSSGGGSEPTDSGASMDSGGSTPPSP